MLRRRSAPFSGILFKNKAQSLLKAAPSVTEGTQPPAPVLPSGTTHRERPRLGRPLVPSEKLHFRAKNSKKQQKQPTDSAVWERPLARYHGYSQRPARRSAVSPGSTATGSGPGWVPKAPGLKGLFF